MAIMRKIIQTEKKNKEKGIKKLIKSLRLSY